MDIREIAEKAHATAVRRGWYEKEWVNPLSCLALAMAEIGEAIKVMQESQLDVETQAPFSVEIADAILILLAVGHQYGWDVPNAVEWKAEINETRQDHEDTSHRPLF